MSNMDLARHIDKALAAGKVPESDRVQAEDDINADIPENVRAFLGSGDTETITGQGVIQSPLTRTRSYFTILKAILDPLGIALEVVTVHPENSLTATVPMTLEVRLTREFLKRVL